MKIVAGWGIFATFKTKQKNRQNRFARAIRRIRIQSMPLRAETKAVNASAFRLFCVDVIETAKAERSTKTETNAESVAHRPRFWRVTF